MQVRRILLISFFLLLFVIAVPLTILSFFGSRNALQDEIGRNLISDAAMLMEEVDMLLFERMQNLHTWSQLDIIQEARVGDIDKRLSNFLNNLGSGYQGMYQSLFYANAQHRIIAASDPALIGKEHQTTGDWTTAKVPNGEVIIEHLRLFPLYRPAIMVIRAPVHDNFSITDPHSTQAIGQLYGLFNMEQLFHLLDKSSTSNSGERYIILLDETGRTIATSSHLRTPEYLLKKTFADWKPDQDEPFFIHAGSPITTAPVLVGYAKSTGYLGFTQLGWTILIIQNTANAFLPIQALLKIFGVVIIVMTLLGILASHWIAGYLSKPLLKLTQWIHEGDHANKQLPPDVGGTIEIRELQAAFSNMLHELALSREQVIQASKLAVIGEMAAIMAHEVRTPLGILSTSAQWLQGEQALSPEGKEMTQFILEESARLKKLVTTLLECARPRAPQMQRQNIHELITHTVELLATHAHKKHVQIELHLEVDNPIISGDAELLTQVLLNLLLNAIQMVPNNGTIHIQSSRFARHFSLEIADNGPGIAAEDYAYLFDPFFTKREGGVGLGLTVTQQIINAHKGKISARQSEWGGACFVITLPIEQE